MHHPRRLLPLAFPIALLAAIGTVGCGSSSGGDGSGASDPSKVQVEASFYPLQWVSQRVGGDAVEVSNLTPDGAEPHDLELTPRDVASLGDADLVVYLSGFQPAVDDAIADGGATSLDVADAADLAVASSDDGHGHGHDGEEDEADAHDDEGGEDAEEADDHGAEDEAADPHFWLDPTRLADVADAVADQLAEIDPDGAEAYRSNAAEVRADLEELDADLEAGLAACENRELVTSHTAFAYLADRYDLHQVGIAGLSPSNEPSPADLAEVSDFVEEHDVRTIYFETLVDPSIAQTIASETGAETAVLDPLEGLTDASEGDDYLAVMRSNLASLQSGQPCP